MNMSVKTTYRPTALAAALTLMLAAPVFGADPYRPSMDQGASTPMSDSMSKSQGMGMAHPDSFGKADANRDGKLTRSEFQVIQKEKGGTDGMMPMAGAQADLMEKRAKDVKDVTVLNRSGTKIGKVDKLVQSRQDNQIYAVVSVGGFLGIGDTEITMALKEMTWKEGKLIAPTTATKQQLKGREDYVETAYREIAGDQTIAQAGQASTQTTRSFEALDANKDNGIDRSEFSAFESGEPWSGGSAAPSGKGMMDKSY